MATFDAEWEEGVDAFCDGKPLSDNPYERTVVSNAENVRHEAWRKGWTDAQKDDKSPALKRLDEKERR